MKLEGKKALVTGASRGIGRAIALALAAEGADVAVNYAGSEAAAKAVAAEIEAMGRKAMVIQADISSNEAATAMIDQAVKEFGRIDVLVNNAGITRDGLLMRMKEEDWDAVLTTNLKGVFNCTKAAVKYMMKQKAGHIVSISSVVGLTGNAGQANYSASKAGLKEGDIIKSVDGMDALEEGIDKISKYIKTEAKDEINLDDIEYFKIKKFKMQPVSEQQPENPKIDEPEVEPENILLNPSNFKGNNAVERAAIDAYVVLSFKNINRFSFSRSDKAVRLTLLFTNSMFKSNKSLNL